MRATRLYTIIFIKISSTDEATGTRIPAVTTNNLMTSELSSSDQTSSMGSGMTGSAGTVSSFKQNSEHSGMISSSKIEHSETLNYNSNATNSNNETTNAGKEFSYPQAETDDDSVENTEIVEQQEQPVKISPKHNPITAAPKVKVTTNIVPENTTISVEVDKDATVEPKIPNTEGNLKENFSSDISTKETKEGSDEDDSTPGATNNANEEDIENIEEDLVDKELNEGIEEASNNVVNEQLYSEGETNETIDENNDVNSVENEKAKPIPESKSENNIPDLEVQGKDESNTKDKASVTNSNDESNRIDGKDIQNRKEIFE